MRTRLIKIGNSRGVRLPKALLQQAGLTDEIEIGLERGAIVIRAAKKPREGWAESVKKYGPSRMLDPYVPTRFDLEEWEWK